MTVIIRALFLLALFSSCASFSLQSTPVELEKHAGNYFVAGPSNGALVIIGVSSRQMREQEEIDAALDDAARKAAFYHGVQGKVITQFDSGNGFFDFYMNVESDIQPYPDADYEQYKAQLRYDSKKDILRTDKAVFVRFTYPVSVLTQISYKSGFVDGQPAWLHGGAVGIPGFITAVGYAGKHRYLRESAVKSYENAVSALLAASYAEITVLDTDVSKGGSITRTKEKIEGVLQGFMILEIWIDPKTEAVWTLAACAKN